MLNILRINVRYAIVVILLLGAVGVLRSSSHAQTAVGKSKSLAASPKSSLIDAAALLKDIETLSADDMAGRSPLAPSIIKAREYVAKRFKESGLVPIGSSFEQPFKITMRGTANSHQGMNLVGLLKGKKSPNKYLIVTAHYDHDGIKKDEIYNGADDNASGTAALFALAKALGKKRPDHSIIFVAFDAEEVGLQGSRHFVANLPVPKESILLNINMDMISRNEKGELYAAGGFRYPSLTPVLQQAQGKAKIKLMLGHDDPKLGKDDWTSQSDQAAFHAAKIPFVYFGVEDHKDYHKPTDDFANIMPDFYVKAVETVLITTRLFDKHFAGK